MKTENRQVHFQYGIMVMLGGLQGAALFFGKAADLRGAVIEAFMHSIPFQ